MKKIKIALAVVVALFISGCGSKIPFKAQEPLADAALVYVYVIESKGDIESASYQSYSIRINGKRVGERLKAGEYTTLDIKPNPAKLSATKDQIVEKSLDLDLKAGETYYLKIRDNLERGAFAFEQVSKDVGAKEITTTGVAGTMIEDIDNTLTELVGTGKTQESQVVETRKTAAPAPTPVSKVDELEKAYKLKEKGALSDEEFNTLKSQIISK
ncbi:hypothetical protein Suden_1916 [Sulfurimonas denitrificans DSM 1251]|jgi:hypothetical protein|uniref:Uncharacterized protein n=1 Tax=Sulfurimonas denitrificans (strain ATCC 33889 / DSM 1251) TaxID=326298 RepID=Q30P91_SULDN|nr:DUF2846 domain-containing protein [Sulfurimonas denitrificans]ABB45190.1 hypothetical protein Suden_1916 [Sulfurimonas denitrificans DSM 1251]MDD3443511.1 DUF2846 domain-containing protein [Sulfurimonas denitrificans]